MSQRDEEALKKSQQLRADYRATFSSAAGVRVLEDLSKRCFAKYTTFKDFDVNTMVFNEGKRAVFLHMQTMIEKKKEPKK